MKKLGEIFEGIEYELLAGSEDTPVECVAYDSRECSPGCLFFAIPGYSVDGHEFISEALTRGASSIMISRDVEIPAGPTVVKVADPRRAMGLASSRFFNEPSHALHLSGVTGTNGKTSIAFLIDALLREYGAVTGMLGTVENRIADEVLSVKRTTPESMDLHMLLARMIDRGCSDAVMEVSSHAIALNRIAGCEYDAAIFTNLSQDHLDFHKDLDSYFDEKNKLFHDFMAPDGVAIVNVDDPRGRQILEGLEREVVTYGINSEDADVRAVDCRFTRSGIAYRIENEKTGPFEVASGLGGKFNVYNSLAMAAFGIARGIGSDVIAATLEKMKGVPGRFEKIEAGQAFQVVVDYAHSPDGLENVLAAAREVCEGRLIVVFGAGGDRDRAKRPLMGAVAARLADIAVVTSDNPRSEEPVEIIDQIVLGLEHQMTSIDMSRNFKYFVEVDRFAGIKKAIEIAEPKDFVVLAGKGHETYQIFRDRTIHFDDREVAQNILKEIVKG